MTPQEAAQWMVEQLAKQKVLDQHRAAWELNKKDKALTYHNANGNLAIHPDVLKIFNKLTNDGDVVWSRSSFQWRYRRTSDRPGRMQT